MVEEALDARGIANFGFTNKDKLQTYIKENYSKDSKNMNNLTLSEDEFVDDNGYTINNNNDSSISSDDIELANKINLLKKSGLI